MLRVDFVRGLATGFVIVAIISIFAVIMEDE